MPVYLHLAQQKKRKKKLSQCSSQTEKVTCKKVMGDGWTDCCKLDFVPGNYNPNYSTPQNLKTLMPSYILFAE
jgi:hypothetical protein